MEDKKLTKDEAIKVLDDLKVKIDIPKSAVTQRNRNIALDMAIQAIEEQRWTPVSERLPKPQEYVGDKDFSDWVQVSIKINPYQSIVCSAYYCFSEAKWYMERMGCGEITAWMPKPQPYKEGDENE